MSEQLKLFRLAGLEDWRIKAFNLGGPLGHVFSRTFELMHTVIRDTTANETSVGYAMESLHRERELALSRDGQVDDPINSLIYGVADNLKVMMDSILEERRPVVEERPQPSNSSSEDVLPQLVVPKEEPLFMPLVPKADPGQEAPCSSNKSQPPQPQPQAQKQQIAQRTTQQTTVTPLTQKRPLAGPTTAAIQPPQKRAFDTPLTLQTAPATPASTGRIFTTPTSAVPTPVGRMAASAAPSARAAPVATVAAANPADANPAARSMAPPAAPISNIHSVRAAAAAAILANTRPATTAPALVLHMCDTCGKSFESDKGLQRHSFIHKALKCEVCHKFVNPNKMKAHLAQYHGKAGKRRSLKKGWDQDSDDDEGVYERRPRTPSPSVASAVSAATTVAYKTPAAVTPAAAPRVSAPPTSSIRDSHVCDKCPKEFETLAGLRRHEYVHDVVQCPICSRDVAKTRMESHLRNHEQDGSQRVETNKDRVDCPITNCSAYRNSPSMMKDHLRVTHGVKPYACDQCELSFFMKTDLVKHKYETGHKAANETPIPNPRERDASPEV